MPGQHVIETIARHIKAKPRTTLSVGVLTSGNGGNLQALIDLSHTDLSYFSIDCVISNNPASMAFERAERAFIPNYLVDHRKMATRVLFEEQLSAYLLNADIELVVLAGFMRVLGATFLRKFDQRVINLHPSLLPKHRGIDAIRKAMIAQDTVTGCTVHLVDEGLDTGPIIAQSICPIYETDTLLELKQRIQTLEHALLPNIVNRIAKTVITRDFV